MVKCSNCGLEVENVNFCPQCGTPVESKTKEIETLEKIKTQEPEISEVTTKEKDMKKPETKKEIKKERLVIPGLHDDEEYGEESKRIQKLKDSGWSFSGALTSKSDTNKEIKDVPLIADEVEEEVIETEPEVKEEKTPKETEVFIDINIDQGDDYSGISHAVDEVVEGLFEVAPEIMVDDDFEADNEDDYVIEDGTAEEDYYKETLPDILRSEVSSRHQISAKSLLMGQPITQETVPVIDIEKDKSKDKSKSLSKKLKKGEELLDKKIEARKKEVIPEATTSELLADYSDEIMVGSKSDVEKLMEKEKERTELFEKQKGNLKGVLSDDNTFKPKRKGLFSSMFSGFADEEEDEKIKAEISKSKKARGSSGFTSVLQSGVEGRKRKRDHHYQEDEERRSDQISQTDRHEKDYDNYYEFVMPLDNMKYEKKSSFKPHLIGIALIFVGAIVIGLLIAKSQLGSIFGV